MTSLIEQLRSRQTELILGASNKQLAAVARDFIAPFLTSQGREAGAEATLEMARRLQGDPE